MKDWKLDQKSSCEKRRSMRLKTIWKSLISPLSMRRSVALTIGPTPFGRSISTKTRVWKRKGAYAWKASPINGSEQEMPKRPSHCPPCLQRTSRVVPMSGWASPSTGLEHGRLRSLRTVGFQFRFQLLTSTTGCPVTPSSNFVQASRVGGRLMPMQCPARTERWFSHPRVSSSTPFSRRSTP